jgi:hypothetical protein
MDCGYGLQEWHHPVMLPIFLVYHTFLADLNLFTEKRMWKRRKCHMIYTLTAHNIWLEPGPFLTYKPGPFLTYKLGGGQGIFSIFYFKYKYS